MFRKIIGVVIIIAGWIAAFYIGLYKMVVQPIINLCIAIDSGGVSAVLIGKTILFFIFALIVFRLIAWLSTFIGALIAAD